MKEECKLCSASGWADQVQPTDFSISSLMRPAAHPAAAGQVEPRHDAVFLSAYLFKLGDYPLYTLHDYYASYGKCRKHYREKNGRQGKCERDGNNDNYTEIKEECGKITEGQRKIKEMLSENRKGLKNEERLIEALYEKRTRNPHVAHVVLRVAPEIWQQLTEAGSLQLRYKYVKKPTPHHYVWRYGQHFKYSTPTR
ncbi:unnamed protein product [Chilo suppressalis]|uniref:Uncharacterized protein n=1 Tax=Chilo suppressalis TaxID=168631 RepID=A0ABN8AYE8_CHISP|nr:unnamed protein product [Chilo suppressalis]